jgi:hypothetical protein
MLAEGSGDVRLALGLAELRVPEDLLYDPDADALVEQQCRRPGGKAFRGLLSATR